MTGIKKLLKQLFFFIVLYGLIGSLFLVANAVDFLDGKDSQDARVLRRDTKIPVGFAGNSIHYITLLKGVPLSEIPLKVSRKRQEVGLSPDIPVDEQDRFFQDLPWKTAKATFIKSPIPGRVVQMNVQSGQKIAAGDIVGIIECMKFFFSISAGSQGEIRDIFFKVGDVVAQGSDLISYTPLNPDWEDVDQDKILESKDLLIFLFSWGARTPPHAPPPKGRWKNMRHPGLLENKDIMVLLYPWMTGTPPTPPNTHPPYKGTKSDALTALSGSETNQQVFTQPGILLSNSVVGHSDQSRKASKGNTTITYDKAERQPSIWQGNTTSFQQKGIQRDEFKDISGISTLAWTPWVCGLVILNKLAFALKSLGYSFLRRVRLKKYAFIISAFPRRAYLYASDCNKHPFVKNQTAHNMNRLYFVRRKFA